ncbi:cornifelin [Plakobranchus ocellatus]|uniref:Cornifelin n=1 Tax=Plakobranchus ocellatus TaxID=259542 RepID=A0AAV4A9U4_9GAST|nr:cornifelin [Plakobranchus ocellatus]
MQVQPQQYGFAPPHQTGYSYGQVVSSQPVGGSTVVVQQQPMAQHKRSWHTGLFDICSDVTICLCGTFLGLCLLCQTSMDMDESICVPLCVPAPLTTLRTKWRAQNNIGVRSTSSLSNTQTGKLKADS